MYNVKGSQFDVLIMLIFLLLYQWNSRPIIGKDLEVTFYTKVKTHLYRVYSYVCILKPVAQHCIVYAKHFWRVWL